MQAFLYFSMAATTTYGQPVLQKVKQALPQTAILDFDAASDELVLHYALKLLREAEKAVCCIKTDESTHDISAILPLLEELFIEKPDRLILLQGQHARLQRMFDARAGVKYKVVTEQEVTEATVQFFRSS